MIDNFMSRTAGSTHGVSVQPIHFPRVLIKLKDKKFVEVYTSKTHTRTHTQRNYEQRPSYQRRRGGGGVQEGCEVLVCVRVLVLVVVLMELEGQGRDARLVLRRPAR